MARRGARWRALAGLSILLAAAACGSAPTVGAAVPKNAPSAVGTAGRSATPRLERCPHTAPAAHTELPALTLACLGNGPAVTVNSLPAQPYIINVWASWCFPCQEEAARLQAAAATARGRVAFIGVDNADDRASALAFLARYDISYPQLSDPNSDFGHRLDLPGIPVTLAIDANGRVVYRRIGQISEAQLTDALRAADPSWPSGKGSSR